MMDFCQKMWNHMSNMTEAEMSSVFLFWMLCSNAPLEFEVYSCLFLCGQVSVHFFLVQIIVFEGPTTDNLWWPEYVWRTGALW